MKSYDISVVIPAFKAVNFIETSIKIIRNAFGINAEIVVVVNDSDPRLLDKINNCAKFDKNVTILNFSKKIGKGKAILEGFMVARGELIGFMDADIPFNIEIIKQKILLLTNKKYDCLIFSKWKDSSFFDIQQPILRKVLSRVFNLFTKLILRLNFRDTQGGCKFLRRETMESIGYEFSCVGFAFDAELLIKLKQKRLNIIEIPVNYCHNEESTVNIFKDSLPVLLDLIKLRHKFYKFPNGFKNHD